MSINPRLAPGESPNPVDPKVTAGNIYRGAMWELATIGKPVPAVLMGVLLVLLLVFAVTGMPWPSIIFSAVLVAVAIWSQRNVARWVEEHNARVTPLGRAAPVARAAPASKTASAAAKPAAKAPARPGPGTSKRAKPMRNRRRP